MEPKFVCRPLYPLTQPTTPSSRPSPATTLPRPAAEAAPTLTGTTGTGRSRSRQVRRPADLDQRLTAYTSRAHVKTSEVMREAIASYLDRHQIA